MQEKSIMEELWIIKRAIVDQYASFREYAVDVLRLQTLMHPEFIVVQ